MFDLPAHPAAENLDKMRHQRRNVFAARPQWRQQEGKNIETVVEVTAKFASLHHLRQVTVRRSDQPNVHLVSPSAAQALELLFLQYAQKFGLQCRRNIAHLVQEKRTFVGQLETANLLRYGSGERASLVTKKLTFQQIQRNGSAIQLYERTPASRAEVVNCARDQLLAGACLSLDKNGGIGWRHAFDLFKDRLQSRALAYDLFESAPIMSWSPDPDLPKASTEISCLSRSQFLVGLNSPSLLEHFRAELHRRMVLPGTPLRLLSSPACAFLRRHVLL